MIRDERDYNHHFDYIHFNPVKHKLVDKVKELPKGHKGRIHPFTGTFGWVSIPKTG